MASPGETYVIPQRRHSHGTARPCKIRCGANEGLYVLNNEANVQEIYTDSLIGCANNIPEHQGNVYMPHNWYSSTPHKIFITCIQHIC